MGIDPGSQVTGYAIIEPTSKTVKNSFQIHSLGVWRLSSSLSYIQRIQQVILKCEKMLDDVEPSVCVLETAYVGAYPQSVIKLAQIRGALLSCVLRRNLMIKEMSAPKVKKAITGGGSASKQQVAFMLKQFFPTYNGWKTSWPADATDALALALAYQLGMAMDQRSSSHR